MALTPKKVYAILKRQISDMEAKLNSPVRYRGTVATADLLPLNPDIGDMYNIESKSIYGEAGMNVAWNGVVWDTMGAPIDMSLYFTKEEAEAVIQRLVTEYFEKNPVKPGATVEQAQQIEQNKTDITSLKTETSSLKEDLTSKADKTALAKTDRKLDVLWKLNQGISYEFQTDDTEAYQKTVPSGAKMTSVKSIGGKTIVWNQLVNGNADNERYSFVGQLLKTKTINNLGIIDKINNFSLIPPGHKILISAKCIAGNVGIKDVIVGGYHVEDASTTWQGMITFPKNTDLSGKTFYNLQTNTDAADRFIIFFDNVGVPLIENIEAYINYFDLTQMFGSGNEPSTPEEFEAMFPADYYPYNAGELMSAPVSEVVYLDTKNQETPYPIPQAILNLPGYGWSAGDVRNEVDWENKQYIQRVGKVDFESVDCSAPSSAGSMYAVVPDAKIGAKSINAKYTVIDNGYIDMPDGTSGFNNGKNIWYVTDSSFIGLSTSDARSILKGVMLYYELAEPIITDISNIIGNTFQEPLEVEAGGTLTFKNSNGDNYRIPVSSSEEYVISLAEVQND